MPADADDAIQADVESIEDPEGSKWYSYAYLTALFATIAGSIVAAVYFGYVTPDLTFVGTVDVGWVVEYTVAALAAIFILFTFSQVANVVGMTFIGGVSGVVLEVIHNAEFDRFKPDDEDDDGSG